ncbi:hypothetical protein ACWDUN_28015 [Mycobacterium sp. NPDC003323]
MKIRLWQRNVIGAAVCVAACVAAAVFILLPAWQRYVSSVEPAFIGEPRRPVTVDGQTFEVRNVSRTTAHPGSGRPLPEGTVLVNVDITRSGNASPEFYCGGFLVDDERSWRATGPPCGAETSMKWRFLIPATAEPDAVDVRNPDGSILVRLPL